MSDRTALIASDFLYFSRARGSEENTPRHSPTGSRAAESPNDHLWCASRSHFQGRPTATEG